MISTTHCMRTHRIQSHFIFLYGVEMPEIHIDIYDYLPNECRNNNAQKYWRYSIFLFKQKAIWKLTEIEFDWRQTIERTKKRKQNCCRCCWKFHSIVMKNVASLLFHSIFITMDAATVVVVFFFIFSKTMEILSIDRSLHAY